MINYWNGVVPEYDPFKNTEANIGCPALDEYVINDGKMHSCYIIIPGGSYDHISNHEGKNVAEELNKYGISAFVLHYRVAPYVHPTYIYDVKRAMRYVRYNAEKYNIDPQKIGVMGFSAGGHMAAMLAEHYEDYEYPAIDEADSVSAKPDSLCLCYPVLSLIKPITHKRTSTNISGDNDKIKMELSAEENVVDDMPPTFIWHTFEDKAVDCRNSLEFASALKEKDCKFELHIFPEGKHGLDLARDVEGTDQWLVLFINWLKRENFII